MRDKHDFSIKPNFKIPRSYKSVFRFYCPTFTYSIFTKNGKICAHGEGDENAFDPTENSLCLDFIHESIERIRWECTHK